MSGKLRDASKENVRVLDDDVAWVEYRAQEAERIKGNDDFSSDKPEYPEYFVADAFDPDYANEIMRMFYTKGSRGSGRVSDGSLTSDIRQVETFYYEDRQLHKRLERIFHNINEAPFFGFDIDYIECPHMCVYHGKDRGHYIWHKDTANKFDYRRLISLSVLLNDPSEFEGGDLELFLGIHGAKGEPYLLDAQLSKAGEACAFKSNDMIHRVKPVTKGTRAALVTWAWGNYGNRSKIHS